MYIKYIKRILDFVLSLIALIVLSPIMLIVVILVRIKLGSPVIFKQQRPGLNERIFTMYKFRTMTDKRDKFGEILPDSQRLTGFGKWLRSTSLDELPELWNILKGDMSIVGPRPLLVKYLELYDENQKKRHVVRPGLTDLSALRGRNNVSWEDQFNHDLEYIENMSFLIDIRIIFSTLLVVFKREGINQEGYATREEYKGD